MSDEPLALLDWIACSTSVFDLAVCDVDDLPDTVRMIGPDVLDLECQKAFAKSFGAFTLETAAGGIQHIAAKFTRKFANHHAAAFGISVNGLSNAWFHPIYSELASLIPMRHLARQLAKAQDGRAIAIQIGGASSTVLNGWRPNALEPFYLAIELRRQNVPVFLFTAAPMPEDARLTFTLSDTWLAKGYPAFRRNKAFSAVMCDSLMRRSKYVARADHMSRCERPGLFTSLRHRGFQDSPYSISFPLRAGPKIGNLFLFSANADARGLEGMFVDLLGPLTRNVAHWFRNALQDQPVRRAHIADHASFEGGLLGAEVVRKGGDICLWPHSANVVHLPVHDPDEVAQVTVAARSTGQHWARALGADRVLVDPQAILPDTRPAPGFDPTQPVHVILFAGAHMLRRVPLVDYAAHKQTWETALSELHRSGVKLSIKHKSTWETRDWITRRAPQDMALTFSRTHANKLRHPNMVFASISMASTALFEGIARGIPGVIIRDVSVKETPYYDPDHVPVIPSDQVAKALSALNTQSNWDKLRDQQRRWMQFETTPFSRDSSDI